MILVTGGAGFIGANFVLGWLAESSEPVVNLDKLTYAGNLRSLASLAGDARHVFVRDDIGDPAAVSAVLVQHPEREAVLAQVFGEHLHRSIDELFDAITVLRKSGPRAVVFWDDPAYELTLARAV